MDKLRALEVRKNQLLDELEVMVSSLENEGEVRSLTSEETKAFDEKKAEIENIEATIERIEQTRANNMSSEDKARIEKRSMEEVQTRALNNFFRGMDLEVEERKMLTSTSTNQALLPLEISKTIMQKLEEQCPILDQARRFNSKGTLRLIKEDSYGVAGITAEDTQFKDQDVVFATVELRAFKVSAMAHATFEMLANVEVDLSNYLLDVIVRRLSKELNRLFLVGTGTAEPQGLVNGKQTESIPVELTIGSFIQMQTGINPSYLEKACWIMNRKTFQKTAGLLDGNGRPYLTSDVIGEKIQYKLLGLPVIVDANVEDLEEGKKAIIMANIAEAYSINILTDITVRHLVESGFTQGFETYAGYLMADGRIVNDEAMVVGVCSTSVSTKAKK